ncbi:NAD(P)-dependent alcohol dehydrogenase [Microbacterium sp. 10M-3C3]|jgi:NADPH:quinone reductase-like Zn-dependent oxidoreductase|uniref:NAD(P)-dependent alcohol dehydrogenase n=1 Tax=Microbacterium sp. 10M-3C3 TaxID=2483401 RepID=UPI00197C4038|nr:NAD(P)-dependent alcohol dehydrogenase [Microbacterium sp. 10M-3C3]
MTMTAAVVHRYGAPDVVRIERVPAPRPRPGEVVVDVSAASVNSGDARIRGAHFPPGFATPARLALGLRGPRRGILGVAVAGTVREVAPDVADLAVGQRVCGMTGARFGAHAEQVAVAARRLSLIPDAVDDEQAAAVLFGGTTALWFLRDRASVAPGERVLVVGGAGAVGSHAVQVARALGAHVTATASTRNVEVVRALGADEVIDRTHASLGGLGARFDVVFDTAGVLHPSAASTLLRPDGRLILAAATLAETLFARRPTITGTASESPALVAHLLAWVADGTLAPLVDAVVPLDRIAEAYARVDSGRKVGTVLVRP